MRSGDCRDDVHAVDASAHKVITVQHDCDNDNLFRDGEVDVDIDDGSIVFTHEDDDETVEITEKGDLIVNGEPGAARTQRAQARRELLRDLQRDNG